MFLPTAFLDEASRRTGKSPIHSIILCVVTPGHAVEQAHRRKMVSSAEDCRREGIAFFPLAAESLGGWHEVAVAQVNKLAVALARHQGEDEQEATRHLWQRLAVLLQKGNAALILNRTPKHQL